MMNTMFEAWSQLAFPGWTSPSPGPQPFSPRQDPGNFSAGFFQHGLRTLRYKLFTPSSGRGTPMPLLVMLHGCGQDADDFALCTGMNALAEASGYLVLYPEQSTDANWSRCWNWHSQTHHLRGEGEPALLAALTSKILAEQCGGGRACIAGLSSGGAMAVILGRTYPELFAAVGCHSGMAHGSATDGYGALLAMQQGVELAGLAPTDSGRALPLIVFHGDTDTTVHHKNGVAVVRQCLAAHAAQLACDVHDIACSDEQGEVRGRSFTRRLHRTGTGTVLAEDWTVHGMGHAWSGGAGHGRYADINGPDASKEMLRFFTEVLAR